MASLHEDMNRVIERFRKALMEQSQCLVRLEEVMSHHFDGEPLRSEGLPTNGGKLEEKTLDKSPSYRFRQDDSDAQQDGSEEKLPRLPSFFEEGGAR